MIAYGRVKQGDVFESRVRSGVMIRIVRVTRSSLDVETLRADGTGMMPRNIAWSTLLENYKAVQP